MDELPGPSKMRLKLKDVCEGSLRVDHDLKSEITNALTYCNKLLRAEGLLTDTPHAKINSVSITIGEIIFEEIMYILRDRNNVVENEQDLTILDHIVDVEPRKEDNVDGDWKPNELDNAIPIHIPLEYKSRAVTIAKAHPNWSFATLRKHGCARLKSTHQLKRWERDVKRGGTRFDKLEHIGATTFESFKKAKNSRKKVTGKMIREWAMAAARPFISEHFFFNASRGWIESFRKKYDMKQREITK